MRWWRGCRGCEPVSLSILTLPGWNGSGPEHWQTHWEQLHGAQRVEQHDWDRPLRGDWMMRLEESVLAAPGAVVLVAHSLACHLVAAWAAHSRHTARVRGALLVAVPDLAPGGEPGSHPLHPLPPELHSWQPVVRQRLPFASLVLASSDDPYASLERAALWAADWGSDFEALGPLGHVNAGSGLGAWPQGWARLQAWLSV